MIDRDSSRKIFTKLLAEQESCMNIFRVKAYKIVCFVKYNYTKQNEKARRVFHTGNDMFGNYAFRKLLEKNRMSVKLCAEDTLYIHKNRY